MRTEDEALVAAVRRGDDRAFELLYGRYHRRIASYVFGMVGDHGRSEDLVQEIFVAALRRMRATERPIAFKPWIYEIARNACIDQFRRSRRAEEVSFDAEEATGALDSGRLCPSVGPDAAVHAKQQLDDLCGAFGGLSDSHHEILVMRELEGLSYREIGERLGLSRPSVESTLFRARKRLTEEYEELVSGERCRRVSELLVVGASELGAREQRRVAKHVAHCQPCRRQAYAAGVDTAVLQSAPRRAVARVAALLPLPAFLRLHQVANVAEPATSWTKAAMAAAVIVAGGAGVAVDADRPVGSEPPARPAAVERTVSGPERPATPERGSADRAQSSRRSTTAGARSAAPRETAPTAASPADAAEPQPRDTRAADPSPAARVVEDASAAPPSARNLPESPARTVSTDLDYPDGSPTAEPRDLPTVNIPANVEQATSQAGNLALSAGAPTGDTAELAESLGASG